MSLASCFHRLVLFLLSVLWFISHRVECCHNDDTLLRRPLSPSIIQLNEIHYLSQQEVPSTATSIISTNDSNLNSDQIAEQNDISLSPSLVIDSPLSLPTSPNIRGNNINNTANTNHNLDWIDSLNANTNNSQTKTFTLHDNEDDHPLNQNGTIDGTKSGDSLEGQGLLSALPQILPFNFGLIDRLRELTERLNFWQRLENLNKALSGLENGQKLYDGNGEEQLEGQQALGASAAALSNIVLLSGVLASGIAGTANGINVARKAAQQQNDQQDVPSEDPQQSASSSFIDSLVDRYNELAGSNNESDLDEYLVSLLSNAKDDPSTSTDRERSFNSEHSSLGPIEKESASSDFDHLSKQDDVASLGPIEKSGVDSARLADNDGGGLPPIANIKSDVVSDPQPVV